MLKYILMFVVFMVGFILFAALQRRFSSETLADGFMDLEKGKEIAPTVFKDKKSPKKNKLR